MFTTSTPIHRRGFVGSLAALAGASILPGCAQLAPLPSVTDEDSAYQLAKEAFLYAYPMAYFARLRHARMTQIDPVTQARMRWNTFAHLNAAVTPATVGAPQTDTFYSRLFHDVTAEPLIIRVPATHGRYWSLQLCDYFGYTFGMPNRRNTTGASVLAIVGPQWEGSLPAGVTHMHRSTMNQGFSLLRMYFAGAADRSAALAVQTGFEAMPLSVYAAGGQDWTGIDGASVYQPIPVAQDRLADFKAMRALWQEGAPARAEQGVYRRFAALGLVQGGPSIESLPSHVQTGMARAEAETRALIVQTTRAVPGTRTANGWVLPKPSIGLYQDHDYLYRATCAQFGTVCTPVDENVYVVAQHEPGFAKRLNGSNRYELHFSREMVPQAAAFWSVHAYNDRYTLIANPAQKYAVGDRTPGLSFNADGSLTLLLQAQEPPVERRANWIPTQPDQNFNLVVRAYEPLGTMRDLTWAGPFIRVLT